MRGQKLILVKGVYSLEKWTKPNPLMSTENRPVDISSAQNHTTSLLLCLRKVIVITTCSLQVLRVVGSA